MQFVKSNKKLNEYPIKNKISEVIILIVEIYIG